MSSSSSSSPSWSASSHLNQSLSRRPTHKLARSNSTQSRSNTGQSRPTSPTKSTSTPLIIHRAQKLSSSVPDPLPKQNIFKTPPLESIQESAPKPSQKENISVCIRLRPLPSSPLSDIDLTNPHTSSDSQNQYGPWLIDPRASQISLSTAHPIIDRRGTNTADAINGSDGYTFTFDKIYDPYSTTDQLYNGTVHHVITSCVSDGYNATVFAYGQTGSGKTFTMMGINDENISHDDVHRGVVPRAINQVFDVIASDHTREYLLRVSYLEIYNETLKDLLVDRSSPLSNTRLSIHENDKGKVYVNGLREEVVTDPLQVFESLRKGEKARRVGGTEWNEHSSRSHTIFTMTIESRSKDVETATLSGLQISSLNLIDLAGSESAAKDAERRKEGSFINKSLHSLSNVISKLATDDLGHIPYRDSKLTRILQTSLSGNAKVVVVCAVSAADECVIETLSTLRFAKRAKMVTTKAERGTILDPNSALLQSYQQEIASLKLQLAQNARDLSTPSPLDERSKKHSSKSLSSKRKEPSKAESDVAALHLERIRLQEQIEHLNRRILTHHTLKSNLRRASLSTPNPSLPNGGKPRRGRYTDFGPLVGFGHGVSGVGLLRGSNISLELSASIAARATELQKEIERLQARADELESERDLLLDRNIGECEKLRALQEELEVLKRERLRESEIFVAGLDSRETEGVLEMQRELDRAKKEFDERVSRLQAEKDELELQVQSIRAQSCTELELARSTILQLNDELQKLMVTAREEKEKEVSGLMIELDAARGQLMDGQREIERVKAWSTETKTEMSAKVAALEAELENWRAQSKCQEEFIRHEDMEAAQRTILELRAERDSGRERNVKLEGQISDLETAGEEARIDNEGMRKDLLSKVSALEDELKDLKVEFESQIKLAKDKALDELSVSQNMISELETDRDRAQERISKLELAGESNAELVSRLEAQVLTLSAQCQESGDLEKRILELGLEKDAQTEVIGKLEGQLNCAASVAAEREAEVEVWARKDAELKAQNDTLRSILEDTKVNQKELASKMTRSQAETNEKLSKLEGKYLRERDKVQDVQLELMQLIQTRDATEHELNQFRHGHKELVEQKNELEEHLILAKQDVNRFRVEVEVLGGKLRNAEDRLIRDEEARRATEDATRAAVERGESQLRDEVRRAQEKALEYQQQAQAELASNHETELEKMRLENSALVKQLTKMQHISSSGPNSQATVAESMETIVDLRSVIGEQKQEIERLAEALRIVRSNPGRPQSRYEHAYQGTEAEIERLHSIIDEQDKMLSEAKSKMAKWQGHIKNQNSLIARIQADPNHQSHISNSINSAGLPLNPTRLNTPTSRSFSKSSAPPSTTQQSQTQSQVYHYHHKPTSVGLSSRFDGSPKPLPLPESFSGDEEWRRRKLRRRTIEEDMAKLKDENVVERKKSVLLASPRSTPNKPKRVLSGLSGRANRLNASTALNGDGLVPPIPSTSAELKERIPNYQS